MIIAWLVYLMDEFDDVKSQSSWFSLSVVLVLPRMSHEQFQPQHPQYKTIKKSPQSQTKTIWSDQRISMVPWAGKLFGQPF